MSDKTAMLITGASGFLGKELINAFRSGHEILALDLRVPDDSRDQMSSGIRWFQVDIADQLALADVMAAIRSSYQVEYVLHLAGYYDFTGEDHPEYERSNVQGMRNVLEQVSELHPKRLIFTSSIAACPFPPPGQAVTESSPPTSPEPYSRSKRAGEELIHAYRHRLPANILRLAAVFTDWCEYAPLSQFLHTWFRGGWDARIIGGRGNWAVPYLHVRDLVTFFQAVIASVDRLEPLEILQGSPDGATSHRQLYDAATAAYFGAPRWAIPVPKPLSRLGIRMREGWGRMSGNMPFERSWMANYIDQSLTVDASYTHRRLGWQPRDDYGILARMPIIVDNYRHHPQEWVQRHQQRMHPVPI